MRTHLDGATQKNVKGTYLVVTPVGLVALLED